MKKKILLFEPWHLGDVAIALSVSKNFADAGVEFGLVCDPNWKAWALSTGIVGDVIEFTPPWTMRKRRDKYNPFHYNLSAFIQFRKRVLAYAPDFIFELRGDIRAKTFLNLLFCRQIPIKSSDLHPQTNVYKRGNQLKNLLSYLPITNCVNKADSSAGGNLTLFCGASDQNRAVPHEIAMALIRKLHQEGYIVNLILQPSDDLQKIQQFKDRNNLSNVKLLHGDFAKMIECLVKSTLVVSTDSGWLHIAHFYEKPTIGVFGFDTIRTWLPPGSSAITSEELYPYSYRYKARFQHLRPLLSLDIDKVIRLVQKLEAQLQKHTATIGEYSAVKNLVGLSRQTFA